MTEIPNPTSSCLAHRYHRGSNTCHQPVEPPVTGCCHAILHGLKRRLGKFTEKLPRVLKPNHNPLLSRILTPTPIGTVHHRGITPCLHCSYLPQLVFTSAPSLLISPSQPFLQWGRGELMEKRSMEKLATDGSGSAGWLFLHLPKSRPIPQAHVSIHSSTTRN